MRSRPSLDLSLGRHANSTPIAATSSRCATAEAPCSAVRCRPTSRRSRCGCSPVMRHRRWSVLARSGRAANRVRERLQFDATAVRLVHGEADLLPSLIVDRYGDVLVVQTLSQGIDGEPRRDRRVARGAAAAARRPAAQRPKGARWRGWARKSVLAYGEVPDVVEVREGPLTYRGRSHARAEDRPVPRSAGESRRGGAGTRAAGCSIASATTAASPCGGRTCPEAEAIDISADAVARDPRERGAKRYATRRGARGERLRRVAPPRAGRRRGTTRSCSTRPPSPRTRRPWPKAMAGYKEINLRAMRLLNPGGTSSRPAVRTT